MYYYYWQAGQQAIVDFNVKEEIEHGAVVVEIVNTEKTLCKDNLIEVLENVLKISFVYLLTVVNNVDARN